MCATLRVSPEDWGSGLTWCPTQAKDLELKANVELLVIRGHSSEISDQPAVSHVSGLGSAGRKWWWWEVGWASSGLCWLGLELGMRYGQLCLPSTSISANSTQSLKGSGSCERMSWSRWLTLPCKRSSQRGSFLPQREILGVCTVRSWWLNFLCVFCVLEWEAHKCPLELSG